MVFEFKLPDIGEGVHEGEIAQWLVSPGDTIREDQPMVEVMTDKVTVEITSPVSGVVQEQRYQAGDVVKVGSVIITIDESGAGAASSGKKEAEPAIAVANGGGAVTTAKPAAIAATVSPASQPVSSSVSGRKVLAAPAVRKLARTMEIDLALVTGSGPHGRIQKLDVAQYPSGSAETGRPARTALAPVPRTERRIPFIGMRRKIGEHLVKSKHTAPHFTYVEEADMTEIVNMREQLLAYAESQGVKLTFLPFIVKAVVEGLKRYPKLNSTLDEAAGEIVLKPEFNLGVAVATDDGLIVPVLRNADQKSLFEIAREIADLGQRARQNKLTLQELQGGTFTLTSIGSIGGIFSAPIINYPEVAIMGIQKIQKRPVVRNDAIVIREMTYFSVSCDHRVVDGAEAALFMKDVIDWLEHPARLLLNG